MRTLRNYLGPVPFISSASYVRVVDIQLPYLLLWSEIKITAVMLNQSHRTIMWVKCRNGKSVNTDELSKSNGQIDQ